MDRYKVNELSDEYETTLIIGVPPRRRDFWKVLRRRYVPEVQIVKRATWKGINRDLKQVWTDPSLVEQLNARSPLMEMLEREVS